MPTRTCKTLVSRKTTRIALCASILSLAGATALAATDMPLRPPAGFDPASRAALSQNEPADRFASAAGRASPPQASQGGIRFAGYGASDDGTDGQDYVGFSSPVASGATVPIVLGPLTSRITTGTFFADDYTREYVLAGADDLTLATVVRATGVLHLMAELTIQIGTHASLAADPSSGVLYAIESDDPCTQTALITIDKSTGGAVFVMHLASCSQALAIDSSGILYSIDRATNALQVLQQGTLSELPALGVTINETTSLAVVPGTDELVLFQFDGANRMYTVDRVTGLATLAGSIGGTLPISAIALAPDDVFADGFDG